jgi:hypothetical protein
MSDLASFAAQMPAEAEAVKVVEEGELDLQAGELLHADPEEVAPVVQHALGTCTAYRGH